MSNLLDEIINDCDNEDLINPDLFFRLHPKDYHFFDRLLPIAIESDRFCIHDLEKIWIFWRRYAGIEDVLEKVFFDGIRSYDAPDDSVARSILMDNNGKPIEHITDSQCLQLLQMVVDYIESHQELSFERFWPDESDEAKCLIEQHTDALYDKLTPKITTESLNRRWKNAEQNDAIEQMCYFYFLNKYVNKGYAKDAVKSTHNWPNMIELLDNPFPEDKQQICSNLELLHKLCPNMGLDSAPYTIGDVLAPLFGKVKCVDDVAQLIKSNHVA